LKVYGFNEFKRFNEFNRLNIQSQISNLNFFTEENMREMKRCSKVSEVAKV